MSKILRRPMFRGGAVDSRGTGITSGLMDTPKYATGGRVGYQEAGVVTGGDLMSKGNIPIDLSALANTRFSAGVPFSYELIPIKDKVEEAVEETETDDRGILQKFYDMFNPSKETIEDRLKKQDEGMTTFDEKMENIGIITNKQKQKIADEIKSGAVDTGDAGTEAENDANLAAGNVAGTGASGNEPSNVEISAQDLIKENAELFKELLNETKEKDLKRARVSDVSDYLLKFFEGSQKEGATVGSAAADVAAFATSKPSATDRAIEAAKKTDQTATALAINDYIAGKRSKEQIKTALALNAAKIKMQEGTLGDKILKAKGSGPVTVTVIRDVLRSEPEFVGMPIQEFDSSKETIEYSPGDENKIFIDTITKETFTYDKNKRKVPIYG
jgi:predicted DNA-binding protein YlxM (UPF0122 family)